MAAPSATGNIGGGLRASGFDPKSPSALMLAGDNASADSGGGVDLSVLYSDDGVGCNQFETAALMRMLDARDEIMPPGGRSPGASGLRALSREYRRSVRDCMAGWEEQLASEEGEGLSEEEQKQSEGNLELLKLSSAFVHLSEIYLLPRGGGTSSTSRSSSGPNSMDIDDGGAASNSSSNIPGSATADTVQYLRFNFEDADSVFVILGTTSEEVQTMMNSEIPEHYTSSANDGSDGSLFWSLVEAYALRGCLREAWAILTHHSAARRVHEAALRGTFDDPSASAAEPFLCEDRDALEILKGIMLGAPLPGGIDTENDHGLGGEDDDNDEDGAIAMRGLDQDDDEDDIHLVKGVARKSYQLWDQSSEAYHPRTAANTHQTWQTAVGRLMTQAGPVQGMMHRTPRLRRLLSILRGQFDGIAFQSWEESLRAELLYVRPSVRPNDIATRAAIAMKQFSTVDEKEEAMRKIMFNIMSGDAGTAIASLQGMGGSSGAALPTTLASLLCNILTSAGSIQSSRLTYDLQTHLLLEASSSILSSFASQSQHAVGVRLSTRLILPFATPDNVRVTSTLAETLGRHAPQSDAETRDLLALCEDLIARGSVRVADACDSLCYCRYQHHTTAGKAGGAAHWLLTGVEIWAGVRSTLEEAKGVAPSLIQVELAGVCGRRFVTVCMETARSLLSELATPSSGQALAHYCRVGKEMLEAIMEGDLAHLVRREQSTALLQHMCDIADAIKDDNRSVLAASIVDCLDEKVDKEVSGSVDILAPPSMRANLLKAALTYILEKEDTKASSGNNLNESQLESSSKSFVVPASAFDVKGVQALMARFAELTYNASFSPMAMRTSNLGGKKATSSSAANLPFDEEKMRLALCNGLERALVSENAKRKESSKPQILPAGVSRQVDLMLGPSM